MIKNVELRKREDVTYPTAGDRDIFVDGKQWGKVRRISHGLWGSDYRITDHHGHIVDTLERRRRRWDEKPAPLGPVLMAHICKLIDTDKLVNPDALDAAWAAKLVIEQREDEEQRQKRRARRMRMVRNRITKHMPWCLEQTPDAAEALCLDVANWIEENV